MPLQDKKELHYVIVELVGEKGAANSIEKGLFQGIKSTGTSDFLWMKTGNNMARSCNLQFYNILSIQTYDGDVKAFTFFMANKEEQKKAREDIDNIFNRLGHVLNDKDPKIVDVKKYIGIPKNFGNHDNKIPTKPNITMGPPVNKVHITGRNTDPYNHSAYVRRDPEPFPFERNTKKPTKIILKKMGEKLDLIMKGEYEYRLPEISNEETGVIKMSA